MVLPQEIQEGYAMLDVVVRAAHDTRRKKILQFVRFGEMSIAIIMAYDTGLETELRPDPKPFFLRRPEDFLKGPPTPGEGATAKINVFSFSPSFSFSLSQSFVTMVGVYPNFLSLTLSLDAVRE
jgi:hypothetical protein